MKEALQSDELAKLDLATQARLADERAPWEGHWRSIDENYPDGAGGFSRTAPGVPRGDTLFDTTHLSASDRFAAAGVAITTPEESQYIRLRFLDDELMKDREVKLWCDKASRDLYGIRHALHTGFGTAAHEDWDQLGRYGTSPVWSDMRPDRRGMFYRTLHLSACFIDTDYAGLVNRVHRQLTYRADHLAELFGGPENLTPKMQEAYKDRKATEFQILQIVAPNNRFNGDEIGEGRFPIVARWLAVDEKIYLRRGGFYSMPIAVSRHMTSAGEKYGRSPAMRVEPTVKGLQAMRRTTLRAAHKAVDPALLFYNDDGRSSIVTKPGGLNPGLVDDMGRALVAKMPGGEGGLPFAEQQTEHERQVVRTAFLEEFYKILTDPNSRMTTTEVLEVMAKQGVLVRPFANRYAQEKQHPISQRELELALREGQIDPLPEIVREAGAFPIAEYENPLSAMARAESTSKTLRWLETLNPIMALDKTVIDYIDTEELVPGLAAEIGVKPRYVRDAAQVAALREGRKVDEQVPVEADAIAKLSGAYYDQARANSLNEGGM